jgi:tubulin-specific chaperone A
MAPNQLQIKVNVVKRIQKEEQYYLKEMVEVQEKIDKMEADGKDFYEVRQVKQSLQETKDMLPDVKKRLTQAVQDLTDYVQKDFGHMENTEDPALQEAMQIIQTLILE